MSAREEPASSPAWFWGPAISAAQLSTGVVRTLLGLGITWLRRDTAGADLLRLKDFAA